MAFPKKQNSTSLDLQPLGRSPVNSYDGSFSAFTTFVELHTCKESIERLAKFAFRQWIEPLPAAPAMIGAAVSVWAKRD